MTPDALASALHWYWPMTPDALASVLQLSWASFTSTRCSIVVPLFAFFPLFAGLLAGEFVPAI
jgi:hypothetical protein